MDDPVDRATWILAREPAGALPLELLARTLQEEGVPLHPSPEALAARLEARSARFRVLHLLRGAWQEVETGGPAADATPLVRERRLPARRGGWVVSRSGEGRPVRGPLAPLGASLRALGSGLDAGSPPSVARWVRLVQEAGRLSRKTLRSAPSSGGERSTTPLPRRR